MAEWQTRRSQKPLSASSCGFDSHCWHQVSEIRLVQRLTQLAADRRRVDHQFEGRTRHSSAG